METNRLIGHPMSQYLNLPKSADACRVRLRVLADEMVSIRTDIVIADIRRQDARRALDAQSFQQARGALQARQNEVAELKAQLKTFSAKGTARAGREGFRDALIEVVRLHCDEPLWAHLVSQARDLSQARGASHG